MQGFDVRRTLAIVALLYLVEGLPLALFRDVLPVWLLRRGVSVEAVGALSGLSVAWSLKFLWSPLVDRFGTHRRWIWLALGAMGALLASLAADTGPALERATLIAIAAFCIASATQDIAIDAFTIALVPRGHEGSANAVRITAYRVALLAGGGGLLLLPAVIGWPGTLRVAAASLLVLAAAVAWLPVADTRPPRAARSATWLPFADALRPWSARPRLAAALGFVLLYRLGDQAMGPMVKPFWVVRGLTDEQIGLVSVSLGALATMAGGAAGGLYVERRGIPSGLYGLGLAALLSNLGYAAAALWPGSGRYGVYAASVMESFCAGLAAAAFMAFLMRICDREHAAVQYACLSALYALPGTVAGALSGWAVAHVGFAAWFAGTAALGLPAFLLLPAARAWADRADDEVAANDARRARDEGGAR